jgi:hypothetical protein
MTLELTDQQALVLYEWLRRFDEANVYPVQDEAEELVFWSLHGQLESALREPFLRDYRERVEAARAHVKAHQPAGGRVDGR